MIQTEVTAWIFISNPTVDMKPNDVYVNGGFLLRGGGQQT